MRDFRNFFFISEHERLGREKNSSQTVFSLNYVDGILDGRYDLEDNKSARMYHFIVKLLKGKMYLTISLCFQMYRKEDTKVLHRILLMKAFTGS